MRMANLHEGQKELPLAAIAYSGALNLDPFYPDALAGLGDAYMKQGNYEAAVDTYHGLLGIVPDHLPALVNLSRTLAGLRQYCEALPVLEKVRDLDRDPSRRPQIDQAIADLNDKCRMTRPQAR